MYSFTLLLTIVTATSTISSNYNIPCTRLKLLQFAYYAGRSPVGGGIVDDADIAFDSSFAVGSEVMFGPDVVVGTVDVTDTA